MSEEQEQLLNQVIDGFTKDKGRPPTEPELMDIMTKLNEAMAAASDDEGDDDSDSDGEYVEDDDDGEDGEYEEDETTIDEQERNEETKRESVPARQAAGGLAGSKHKIDLTPSPALKKELEASSMAAPTKRPKVAA